MTLLITLAAPWGVHQSSDYRLTPYVGSTTIEDIAGVKQLHASYQGMHLEISLTGLATFDGTRTIDWIAAQVLGGGQATTLSTLCSSIATRATESMRRYAKSSGESKPLTIVVASAIDKTFRITRITNCRSADKKRLKSPSETFCVLTDAISRPSVFIDGYRDCVSPEDLSLLRRVIRKKSTTREHIHGVLASVNARASANSNRQVSSECWVSSLWFDEKGIRTVSRNVGQQTGQPHSIMGGVDFSKMLTETFGPEFANRKIVQSASFQGRGTPLPPPTGERKLFSMRSEALAFDLSKIAGGSNSFCVIPLDMNIELEKNNPIEMDIATVAFRIDPTSAGIVNAQRPPYANILDKVLINNEEFSSGFNFAFTYSRTTDRHVLTIVPSSCGVRDKRFLQDDEEFVIVRPTENLVLAADVDSPTVIGAIRARLWWRTRADGTRG